MFRKKRSVIQNAFAGRLPLRDVDLNETYVLDSNKPPSAEKKSVQGTPHTSTTQAINTEVDVPKPPPTVTTLPHTTHTPNVTNELHSCNQTSSQKTVPSKQENPVTPASTFPVSNPAVILQTTNNTNPPTPSTASAVQRSLKSSVPRPLSLVATAEESSQQAGATPLCRPPTIPPGSTISERKANTGEQDSRIVVLNDRKFKKLCVLGTGGSSKVR